MGNSNRKKILLFSLSKPPFSSIFSKTEVVGKFFWDDIVKRIEPKNITKIYFSIFEFWDLTISINLFYYC